MESNKIPVNRKFQYPSTETLRRLYTAADEFQELTPWQWMGDREVVAVHDLKTLNVGYCVVTWVSVYGLEVMLGRISACWNIEEQ